jgi:hypothetical protein
MAFAPRIITVRAFLGFRGGCVGKIGKEISAEDYLVSMRRRANPDDPSHLAADSGQAPLG